LEAGSSRRVFEAALRGEADRSIDCRLKLAVIPPIQAFEMGEVDDRLLAHWLNCRAQEDSHEPDHETLWEQAASAVSGIAAPVVRLPMEDR
jgi:hypothetical protein